MEIYEEWIQIMPGNVVKFIFKIIVKIGSTMKIFPYEKHNCRQQVSQGRHPLFLQKSN